MDIQSLPWYGQLLIFLVIGGIVIGIFYYIHYSPTQDTINTIEDEIERVEREIKIAERKQSKMKQIEEELEVKRAVLERLKEILPERKEISQILTKIESLIMSTKLRIQKFAPQKERTREIYVEWPIAISLDGAYHNLGIFFDQVSKFKKIFTIDGLRMTPLSNMTSDFTISANFTATTYIYREKESEKKR